MEVFDVLHVDGGTADVLDACACCVKNVLDVLQRLGCLLAGSFASQFAGGRVDAQLAGDEHETVGLHSLAVSAQRRRGFRSRNLFHLLAHNVSPLKNVLLHLACVQAAANHDNAISNNHCTHGIDAHCPMFQIPAQRPGPSHVFVVGLMGIEPTTFCSGDRRSIH